MTIPKSERVMRIFERKDVDYLPSMITFSDRAKYPKISEALGLDGSDALEDYLQNHIFWTYAKDDVVFFYRNDSALMASLEAEKYVAWDHARATLYDRWGLGILAGEEGLFCNYGCLAQNETANANAREYLPERITKLWDMPIEKAVDAYEAPDPLDPANLEWLIRDKDGVGDMLVIPTGYMGIYERAYTMFGFENFMLQIALTPYTVNTIMEKITDYRIKLAKVKAELGYKVVHHGDDVATQLAGLFSISMFREMILPHLKRLFAEYKKYDQYIMLHSCGRIIDYLPDLIDIGLDAWEPVQPCNDLRTLKREFGKDLIFMGGIDTQQLPRLTPDKVREMTKEVISILGKGGGYIIAPSQEIMSDVPLENVVALLETVVEMRDKVL
ncbi:uroporphyrinogen decarboxylase [Clostridia bacterium]|nr:uroporphyrinogen decarboxylase [Clostridia bacterium]